ncbi:hypothetical protein BT96DRAFT_933108 [Gymnopus androsaceus JB14]|uniref:Uncharacterized protein n=1 Tax=Gymnopus androsaceus JB14 TaxID=1447944 RepID=A0A6A4IAJ1_9AGAR|nr:hypothetical protein BT96DRAFT_933108 [Gymnopus androsaceus JB14]
MKNHAWGSGWGNILQEMLLNTHLAYLSGRSFVFDNYTWDRSPSEYSSFNGKKIPSRVPVSTMLAGPIIGGSFDPSYFTDPLLSEDESHPRFVSSEYYERVCADQKTIINTAIIRDAVASWDGKANLEAWVEYLQSLPDRCVEFEMDASHIFNIWMFGSTQILTLWPSLSQSPILKQFSHSPLILGAFERHRHLFGVHDSKHGAKRPGFLHLPPALGGFLPDLFHKDSQPSFQIPPPQSVVPVHDLPFIYPHAPANPNINDTIPGLLVLHIRRGDFADHCINLVQWGSSFNGFNSFDDLRERDGFDAAAAGAGTPLPGAEPVEPESELDFAARLDGMSEEDKTEARRVYADSVKAYAAAKRDYDDRKANFETAKAQYLERCFPDIDQIVRHVRQVREDVALAGGSSSRRLQLRRPSRFQHPSFPPSAPLTHIYIMTNAKLPFLAQLRLALENDAINNNRLNLPPWESIYSSRDLELGWEEGHVAQALDMYVAQRAEVFVGNGFSSLTSNIIMLRKANGVESVKTRLW